MGFNKGALGMSTRELVKGFAKPEVLAKLLPQKSARILARSKMPRVDLPIYYLDGSLLPGYSGSPVVNEDGKLIGIGNGGLENGASSVSWVIPADNLQQLLTSSITTIPDAFIVSKALFSGDRIASRRVPENVFDYKPYKPDSPLLSFWRQIMPEANAQNSLDNSLDASLDDLNWSLPAFQFREVNYQNFQFVRIKSRSFAQMLASSGDPDSLNHALTLFDAFFPDYKVPYHNMAFDVYTDSHYGLNLIVPTGAKLTVEDGFLLAQGTLFCQLCPYEIQYHARDLNNQLQMAIAEDAPAYLNDIAHQHWGELNQEGDYQEYVGFRQVEDYGSGRHVLRAAFSDFDEPFKREHELNYFVAATNRDAWFQVQGIINVFDNRFSRQLKKYAGTDCSVSDLNQKQQAVCSEVTRAFKVLASAHFTSFSNRLF